MNAVVRYFSLAAVCLFVLFTATAKAQNGVAVCKQGGNSSVITCTIAQPVVDQRAQNGYHYNNVVFTPGDLVTITAGGCVQTGGTGATWKRYVNPSGDNSNRLYFGTIGIPGVTPPGATEHIQKVQQYNIPAGVAAPNNVLVLGYTDDNYSDNGYWGHDNGNNDQCKEGTGLDGGPAWLVIVIEHGLGKNLTPSNAPFDLMAGTIDTNGLPFNPEWGFEQGQTPAALLTTSGHPDATKLCDGFPTGADNHVGLGNPPCTSQGVQFDMPGTISLNNALCSHAGTSGKLHGHVDWWPATVTGNVIWAGHDSTISESGGSLHFGDDDYNFELFPSNSTLLTIDPQDPGDNIYIESEFDSDETIDHFGSQWWTSFHSAVDNGGGYAGDNSSSTAPASVMVNGKPAIITGLVGLDSEHGAYSELHPIYAMAIHLNSDVNNDQWSFFARNWGDEGYCSQEQHYWDVSSLSIFIPEPVPSSDFSFVTQDLYESQTVPVQAGKVQGGLVLTFGLGTPESRALVDGSVTIKWVPTPPTTGKPVTPLHGILHPFVLSAAIGGQTDSVSARLAAAAKVTPENDSITLPALAADKKATLLQQMQKPTPAKNKIHVQATRATLTAHLQKSVKIAQPKTHVAPDTVKAARDQRQSQAICAAYGNNIPGIPNACK
jgi:hypothetical protein